MLEWRKSDYFPSPAAPRDLGFTLPVTPVSLDAFILGMLIKVII
jgi:hypothetical protein